ncbi:hypothetical protein Pnap_4847 (plasmid) [Polaromonas naphthalenivorans CJ2]|uniref:Uncharacterized protein n=1 Tax=Polaromonas naphthalenivorans (strain CJ2) TaxID=365044 RepID=A1VW84_POLNA|nr:hypothetical protein Pnap_4847 [Polaromonas naphthalenivorans CJ2]
MQNDANAQQSQRYLEHESKHLKGYVKGYPGNASCDDGASGAHAKLQPGPGSRLNERIEAKEDEKSASTNFRSLFHGTKSGT